MSNCLKSKYRQFLPVSWINMDKSTLKKYLYNLALKKFKTYDLSMKVACGYEKDSCNLKTDSL